MAAEPTSTVASFLVRLTPDEREALRLQAETEHRSMQDVARSAILDHIAASTQKERALQVLGRVMERDAELLDRLAR